MAISAERAINTRLLWEEMVLPALRDVPVPLPAPLPAASLLAGADAQQKVAAHQLRCGCSKRRALLSSRAGGGGRPRHDQEAAGLRDEIAESEPPVD
mmetsp:Transcript_24494/g.57012  ORF Transcript_24494/g.57012 Transcript_24494/m.57012 type:complete len:97 (-) Transcript_24494:696-986(-)